MSQHRQPGRRRAPGRVRRLPDGFPRSTAAWAVKSVAGLGVVGGAAVALTVPVDTADAEAESTLALSQSTTAVALAQRTGDVASRSSGRAAAPAVEAPAAAAPQVPEAVGVAGVKAVAKPKPKPKPKPAPEQAQESSGSSTQASAGSWDGTITGRCSSIGLIANAKRLCSAVDEAYGPPTIGGIRASNDEHGTGQAVDFMIANAGQGDAIAAYVQAHVSQFNVKYLIWQQRYWAPGEGWSTMEDRGSATANHYDHVHVTMNF